MYLLYSIVLALGLLAFTPLFLLRNSPEGRYTRFLGERFGRLPPRRSREAARGAIWVHAVSVGEALAMERLIEQLRQRFPERPVVLSVTTATGRAVAERRIQADEVFYFPLDFRFAVRRSLKKIRPALVLIAETEIWPNFLREAELQGAHVMFLNGRISGRSYARYRLVRRLLRPTLARASSFLMQTPTDAERIQDLGAPPEHVTVAGNLKFDVIPPEQPAFVRRMRERLRASGIGPVLVAGSTMEGEEAAVLEAYRAVCAARAQAPAGGQNSASLLLILAPRHPQRFAAVAAMLQASGLPWTRRTELGASLPATPPATAAGAAGAPAPDPQAAPLPANGVLLLDSLGELTSAYRLATAAFVGGSLTPHGGHNILEPAYWGVPVIFGPHMDNFARIAEQFLAAGAGLEASSAQELAHLWQRLLDDVPWREHLAGAARELLASQRGATNRALEAIARVLGEAGSAGEDETAVSAPAPEA